jgi:hypothetical protein
MKYAVSAFSFLQKENPGEKKNIKHHRVMEAGK